MAREHLEAVHIFILPLFFSLSRKYYVYKDVCFMCMLFLFFITKLS